MNTYKFLIFTTWLLVSPMVLAQQTISYLSVPASGFTPRNSTTIKNPLRGTVETLGYSGNVSGTARFFGDNGMMFAPVFLPHNSKVISFACAGNAPRLSRRIIYVLRRNEPQRANVDMASIFTSFSDNFQFKSTISIQSPIVDNQMFNYYIVASIGATNDINECRTCSVNRCTIGFVTPPLTREKTKGAKLKN